ncbi:MAG TPA: AAA family ATPase [Marmoricola sp.]|nr:AAA family ATPase [Marmoricola sp.]
MSCLIHLNGPPGIGKSTLARRYAAEHPGTLNCDVDVLRTLIGGWQDDFARAGELIRPAALAMIEAYLRSGHDVVLPQMLVDPTELARFEAAATGTGAEFVERVLMDTPVAAVARFGRRGAAEIDDPWHDQVRAIVAANGGVEALAGYHAALEDLLRRRPSAVVIMSTEGAADLTYRLLIESLDRQSAG